VVSGGVFTVLIAVGLIPRFAGKTHTSNCVLLYENIVIAGTITGNLFSLFPRAYEFPQWISASIIVVYGLFAGIFVGCLAIAIAEMLNAIPIFARRIGFRKGISIALLSMAGGKIVGSILYFLWN
ncbi:MAG: stage V sporulation protein AB, partial [Eubacteriales bacterium]